MMKKQNTDPSTPLLPDHYNGSRSTNSYLITAANGFNYTITTIGMVSLGLLAMLITHHDLKTKDWPLETIIPMDALSFITTIIGKTAIVLFFNHKTFINGIKQLSSKKIPDFWNFKKRNWLENLGWCLNLGLSINVTLFWMGLVQVSFKNSGDLLNNFDAASAKKVGYHMQQWYSYIFFMFCSFCANIFGWPNAHYMAFQQKKSFFNWLLLDKKNKQLRTQFHFILRRSHRNLLKELKNIINHPELIETPIIDALTLHLIKDIESHHSIQETEMLTLIQKLDIIINADLQSLRQAYLAVLPSTKTKPPAHWQHFIKQSIAIGTTGICIWGFRNVIGISHSVWENWGAENISKKGSGYLTYYSIAETVSLTVYPLLCGLFDIAREGIIPPVFSNFILTFNIAVVFFVGILGGLANAERSYLDSESTFDFIAADLGSFLVDAFAIYMILKIAFENKVNNTPHPSLQSIFKDRFLKLQKRGHQACDLDSKEAKSVVELTHPHKEEQHIRDLPR